MMFLCLDESLRGTSADRLFPASAVRGICYSDRPEASPKHALAASESINRGPDSPRVQVNKPGRKPGLSVSPVSPFEMQKLGQILHKIKRAKQIKRQPGPDEAVVLGSGIVFRDSPALHSLKASHMITSSHPDPARNTALN